MISEDITVVIPNFNHAKYISYALDSIISQTQSAKEILVIDDCSTDDSVKVIGAYFDRIQLIKNKENMGVNWTMNYALSRITTPYVMFVAADDIVQENLLEKSISILSVNKNAALCSSLSSIIDENSSVITMVRSTIVSSIATYLSPQQCFNMLNKYGSWFMSNTALFNVDKLRAINGFQNNLGSMSDNVACQHLALQHGACFIPEVLGNWRRLKQGYAVSTALNPGQTKSIINEAVKYMNSYPNLFSKTYIDRAYRRYKYDFIDNMFRENRSKKSKDIIHEINQIHFSPLINHSFMQQVVECKKLVRILYFLELRYFDVLSFASRRLTWFLRSLP